MAIQTAHPHHHVSPRTVGLAAAGALLAVGAGAGITMLVVDDAPAPSTGTTTSTETVPETGIGRGDFTQPEHPATTNRENRELMHRR